MRLRRSSERHTPRKYLGNGTYSSPSSSNNLAPPKNDNNATVLASSPRALDSIISANKRALTAAATSSAARARSHRPASLQSDTVAAAPDMAHTKHVRPRGRLSSTREGPKKRSRRTERSATVEAAPNLRSSELLGSVPLSSKLSLPLVKSNPFDICQSFVLWVMANTFKQGLLATSPSTTPSY